MSMFRACACCIKNCHDDAVLLKRDYDALKAVVARYVWLREHGGMGATDAEATQDAYKVLKALA